MGDWEPGEEDLLDGRVALAEVFPTNFIVLGGFVLSQQCTEINLTHLFLKGPTSYTCVLDDWVSDFYSQPGIAVMHQTITECLNESVPSDAEPKIEVYQVRPSRIPVRQILDFSQPREAMENYCLGQNVFTDPGGDEYLIDYSLCPLRLGMIKNGWCLAVPVGTSLNPPFDRLDSHELPPSSRLPLHSF